MNNEQGTRNDKQGTFNHQIIKSSNQFIINTFTLLCKILNAISAIRFSLSSVGFTSAISKQQILRCCINLLIRSSASLSFKPLLTGVPVPREIEESRLSTSKLT